MKEDKKTKDASTFNFSWNKKQAVSGGTVFRKREKPKHAENNTEKPERKQQAFLKDDNNKQNFKTASSINNNAAKPARNAFTKNYGNKPTFQKKFDSFPRNETESEDTGPKTFIKRKGKKDKQLMKEAREKGEETTQKNATSTLSHNLFSERGKNLYVDTRGGVSVSEKVFAAGRSVSDLNIHKYLVSNLEKHNFHQLTTVQDKSIPVILSGKDVLVRSQTGSGKTLAYAVPIIDALQGHTPKLKRADGVQAIIVVPTRELALQTHELFSKINVSRTFLILLLLEVQWNFSQLDTCVISYFVQLWTMSCC